MDPKESYLDDDRTPDGMAARGEGLGVTGVENTADLGAPAEWEDLQDDLGEDPTLMDEDSGV